MASLFFFFSRGARVGGGGGGGLWSKLRAVVGLSALCHGVWLNMKI